MTAGVDVSKARLDWCCGHREGSVPNNHAGATALAQLLGTLRPRRVVLESTGGYERQAAGLLTEGGLPVYRVNPRLVRNFARACNLQAKTDRLDARLLADYGERLHESSWRVFQPGDEAAANLLRRRRQLVDMIGMERNRLETADLAAEASILAVIDCLENQVREVESALDRAFEQDADLQAKAALLQSVPGVGPVVARTLLLLLPELGTLDRKRIAALAGLAPFNNDSGKARGSRHIRHGRSEIRTVLYIASLPAIRFNPVIRRVWAAFKARGLGGRTGRIAIARRLLVIANAIIRDGCPWRETG